MRSDLLEPSGARGKREREREPTDPETQTGREEGKKVRPTGEETDARGSPAKPDRENRQAPRV